MSIRCWTGSAWSGSLAMPDGRGSSTAGRFRTSAPAEWRWRTASNSATRAAFQNSGDFVAYVGDGASDVPAAKLAQAVFARSTLLERLQGVHSRVRPFETFDDVTRCLRRNRKAGWQQPRRKPSLVGYTALAECIDVGGAETDFRKDVGGVLTQGGRSALDTRWRH